VDLGFPSALQLSGTGMAISAWVKLSASGAGSQEAIVIDGLTQTGQQGCNGATSYVLSNYFGTLDFELCTSSTALNAFVVGGFVPQLNTWYHIVGVYDGSNIIFYRNGVPLNQTPATGTISANTGFQYNLIGFDTSRGASSAFSGLIDEVRVYNRALSTEEIKRLYKIGATTKVNVPRKDTLTDGLVGSWTFDGPDMAADTAYDRSGNANNGTLTNGPVRTEGKIGQALSFDGVDDYVDISNESAFDFERTDPFSISAWVKYPAGAPTQSIVSKMQNSGNFPGYEWKAETVNHRLSLNLRDSSAGSIARTSSFDSLMPGIVYHVLMTYNGNSTADGISFYINGVDQSLSSAGSFSGSMLNDTNVSIGRNLADAGGYSGLIDDVRIYNRALSPDEIKRLYNMGR